MKDIQTIDVTELDTEELKALYFLFIRDGYSFVELKKDANNKLLVTFEKE